MLSILVYMYLLQVGQEESLSIQIQKPDHPAEHAAKLAGQEQGVTRTVVQQQLNQRSRLFTLHKINNMYNTCVYITQILLCCHA